MSEQLPSASNLQNSEHWDALYAAGRQTLWETHTDTEAIIEVLPAQAPRTILDIGCGTDSLLSRFAGLGFEAVGLDFSTAAIARQAVSLMAGNVAVLHGDIEDDMLYKQPILARTFGIVVCKKVIGFMHNKQRFIDRAMQLVDPSGVFVFVNEVTSDGANRGAISSQEFENILTRLTVVREHSKDNVTRLIGTPKTSA